MYFARRFGAFCLFIYLSGWLRDIWGHKSSRAELSSQTLTRRLSAILGHSRPLGMRICVAHVWISVARVARTSSHAGGGHAFPARAHTPACPPDEWSSGATTDCGPSGTGSQKRNQPSASSEGWWFLQSVDDWQFRSVHRAFEYARCVCEFGVLSNLANHFLLRLWLELAKGGENFISLVAT